MTFPRQLTWIDGAPQECAVDTGDRLHDPNTGADLAPIFASSVDQVDAAVAAAARAHAAASWRGRTPTQRAAVLGSIADALDLRADDIARWDALNSGVPIAVTRLFAASLGDTLRAAAARAVALGDESAADADHGTVTLGRVPWGPTALILPWNAPSAMAVKKLAFALAAGATVVMKPSPQSPWSALLLVEEAHAAGVPAGVVNLVLGGRDVGERLVADERIAAISMTGSTPTGRAIATASAGRFARLRLELGSNNPAVIRADADIVDAARIIGDGALKLSGQWCEAPRRVFAPHDLVDAVHDALVARFSTEVVGSSLDEDTTLGPVAFRARRDQLEAQVAALEAAGARITRLPVPAQGSFFAPTVATVPGGTVVDEMFGPLITVTGYGSEDEAVDAANEGPVGLAGYVLTRDVEAGMALGRRLTAGEVKVNGSSVLDMAADSRQSFFGSSGLGGHGDADVLDFFVGTQIIGTDRPGLPL